MTMWCALRCTTSRSGSSGSRAAAQKKQPRQDRPSCWTLVESSTAYAGSPSSARMLPGPPQYGLAAQPHSSLSSSFSSLPGLKYGIRLGGTSTLSPVFGLRPSARAAVADAEAAEAAQLDLLAGLQRVDDLSKTVLTMISACFLVSCGGARDLLHQLGLGHPARSISSVDSPASRNASAARAALNRAVRERIVDSPARLLTLRSRRSATGSRQPLGGLELGDLFAGLAAHAAQRQADLLVVLLDAQDARPHRLADLEVVLELAAAGTRSR